MFAKCLVLFTLFYTSSGDDQYLPSYIKPCSLTDTKFAECVKTQMETALPHFTKGIPELGVPSLDPVKLDDINIDGNGLKLQFTNASMQGISDAVVNNLKVDIGKNDETFSLSFKCNLTLVSKYVVDGQILVLPIKGKGDAKIKARNVDVKIDSKLTHVKDAKGMHFKLIAPSYKYDIENTKFHFDNLFNGNKQLGDATHQFMNQNWKQLMDDLSPPVIKQIVRTCVKAINKFFAHVTIDRIVSDYKES